MRRMRWDFTAVCFKPERGNLRAAVTGRMFPNHRPQQRARQRGGFMWQESQASALAGVCARSCRGDTHTHTENCFHIDSHRGTALHRKLDIDHKTL